MVSFTDVRNYLSVNGKVELPYSTNPAVLFTAKADICRKGDRLGQPIIRITSGKQTNILIYEEDWGNSYTTSRTLIKHATKPLEDYYLERVK